MCSLSIMGSQTCIWKSFRTLQALTQLFTGQDKEDLERKDVRKVTWLLGAQQVKTQASGYLVKSSFCAEVVSENTASIAVVIIMPTARNALSSTGQEE